eukprot:GFUD01083092.1.p1 GENE.GFUD01083092.1~~GFUD01083092.1.p1  ORF type:complete len:156 (+),score=40.61 GFUD01083092.1:24-470(+)
MLQNSFVFLCLTCFTCCATRPVFNVRRKELSGGVAENVELIKDKLTKKGFNVFATVDHAKNADGVGLELRPTTVIIFGNPTGGTKLMQCAQEYAIDLPQKVLVYEDADGKVWAVINSQLALAVKHGATGCRALVEKVNGKLGKLLGSF